MKNKSFLLIFAAVIGLLLGGCAAGAETEQVSFQQVSAQDAKALMESEKSYTILDVRTQSEYAQGHIPDAILIPHDIIEDKAEKLLPDKDAMILVYCRSGNRSKVAAEALAELGYRNVVEFGGIIDWPYETEQ